MDTSDRRNDISDKLEGAAETAHQTTEQLKEALQEKAESIQAGMAAASEAAQGMLESAGEQLTEYARVTDQAIRKNPYQALGIALGVGLLCGYLIKRK